MDKLTGKISFGGDKNPTTTTSAPSQARSDPFGGKPGKPSGGPTKRANVRERVALRPSARANNVDN